MRPVEHVERFGTMGGELKVGGMPLSRLAARVGSTPFFAYDRGLLDERVFALRPDVPKEFDAVYDARCAPFKRHELAAAVAAAGGLLVVGGVVALFYLIFFRVTLEFFYAVVRMSEDIHHRR